jgi:hypothetical protein
VIDLEELEKLLAEAITLKAKFKTATHALDAAIKADEPTGASQPVVQDHMNAHADWRAWVMVNIDDLLDRALPELIAMARENERLREALTFYAARENYNDEPLPNNMWKTAKAVFDGGKRARTALKEKPQ